MYKYLLVVLILPLGMAASAATPSNSGIGFVNMAKVVQTTRQGKKIKTDLETDFNKKKKDFATKEEELRLADKELEKKKSVLSEEAYGQKRQELQNQMNQFRELLAKGQGEIQKKQNELVDPLIEKIRKVVAKMAKDKSLSLVLENAPNVIYAAQESDFTEEVIKAVDSEK
jgi:outer membrane protein